MSTYHPFLESTNLEIELSRSPDELDFIDVDYNGGDELYATKDEPQNPSTNFDPIRNTELLQIQLHESFYAEIHPNIMSVDSGF